MSTTDSQARAVGRPPASEVRVAHRTPAPEAVPRDPLIFQSAPRYRFSPYG